MVIYIALKDVVGSCPTAGERQASDCSRWQGVSLEGSDKDETSRPFILFLFISPSALMKMSQAWAGKFPIKRAANTAWELKYLCLLKNKQCPVTTRLSVWLSIENVACLQ